MFVDDDTASVQGQLEDPLAGGRGIGTGDIFECHETRRRLAEIYRLLATSHAANDRERAFNPIITFYELRGSNAILERNIGRVEDQLDRERYLVERQGQEIIELRRERDALVDDNTHLRAQIADLTNQINGGQNIDIIEI
jgi:septal ring factor EnvC (AmiA/AmiB activator)